MTATGRTPARRAPRVSLLAGALLLAILAGGRATSAQAPDAADDRAAADTSADGRWIVQVRATPGDTVAGPVGAVERTQLWLVERDGGRERLLLAGGSRSQANGTPFANFQVPQFSPDGRRVYVMTASVVTSDAVAAIDVATGAVRELCGANDLHVVRRGPRAGDLLVEQHRYRRGGGAYECLVLVSPGGATRLVLGDADGPRARRRAAAILAGGR